MKTAWRLFVIIHTFVLFQFVFDKNAFVSARTITLLENMYQETKGGNDHGIIMQLSSEDIILQGLSDRVEMNYEVPVAGAEKGSYLSLNVQYSPLLLNDSTITVSIDGNPVESVKLDAQKRKLQLNIPLEGQAISQGFHKVTIAFYGQISEHDCANVENPANWLTITNDSHLFLNVDETRERNLALEQYPYPFIQNHRDDPVQSTIVIPDKASLSIVKAALMIANYLHEQIGRTKEVPIVLESDIDTISTHIIAIGKETDWSSVIKKLYESANVKVRKNELVASNHFLSFPKATKQILFVTATDDQTFEDKIAVLSDNRFVSQLSGDEIAISQLQKEKNTEKQTYAFHELNIPNVTLTGSREKSPYYFVQMPAHADIDKPMTLHLRLKVSETLFNFSGERSEAGRAELVVYVNDEPYSIAIDELEKNEHMSTYDVTLTLDSETLKTSPIISLQFQANGLKRHEVCKPPDSDQWIYISENSRISWSKATEEVKANSRIWPAPFSGGETAIVLPNEVDGKLLNQLQLLTNRLGNARVLDNIQLSYADDIDIQTFKNRHVIVLGSPYTYSVLKEKKRWLIPFQKDQLDLTKYRFVNETAKHVVWLQPSLWNEKRSLAVFSAVHPEKTKTFLSEEIVDYLRTTGLQATVIVEHENGEIFTNAQQLEDEQKQTFRIDEQDSTKKNRWFIFGIFALAIIVIILLVSVIRKTKKDQRDD